MSPPLSFVRATLGDVPRIEALVSDAYAPYVARIEREPAPMRADYAAAVEAGRVLLAVRDSWLAGVLVTEVHSDYLLVENVAVDPQAQGMGVGAQLLGRADGVFYEIPTPCFTKIQKRLGPVMIRDVLCW